MSLIRNKKWKYRSHGSPLYKVWNGMINRCTNQKNINFSRYGGRGISVCDRWKNYDNFVEDMGGGFLPGVTLDRIDNDLGYFAENCRWADRKVQAENRSTSWSILDENVGDMCTLSKLAKRYGLSRNTITSRIRLGYSSFRALVQPTLGRGRASYAKQFIRK